MKRFKNHILFIGIQGLVVLASGANEDILGTRIAQSGSMLGMTRTAPSVTTPAASPPPAVASGSQPAPGANPPARSALGTTAPAVRLNLPPKAASPLPPRLSQPPQPLQPPMPSQTPSSPPDQKGSTPETDFKSVVPRIDFHDSARSGPNPNSGTACPSCLSPALRDVGGAPPPPPPQQSYTYDRCSNQNNVVVKGNYGNDAVAKEMLRYQNRPPEGPAAKCIHQAQNEISPSLLINCQGGAVAAHIGSRCVSKELHQITANVYHDLNKCLGLEPRDLLGLIWKESNFTPNASSSLTGADGGFHGYGQYSLETILENGKSFGNFSKPLNFPAPGGAEACSRLKAAFVRIPVTNPDNLNQRCLSTSHTRFMVANMIYTALDHVRFRDEFQAVVLNRRLSGVSDVQAKEMAKYGAHLAHMVGFGGARTLFRAYVDFVAQSIKMPPKRKNDACGFPANPINMDKLLSLDCFSAVVPRSQGAIIGFRQMRAKLRESNKCML